MQSVRKVPEVQIGHESSTTQTVCTQPHAYNAEWAEFLKTNPTKEQVLQFGKDLMERFGQAVRY